MTNNRIWYGLCTYWTDDFNTLATTPGGIPCCPQCGAVGFEANSGDWARDLEKFEYDHPGYADLLKANKQVCHGRGVTIMDLASQAGIL